MEQTKFSHAQRKEISKNKLHKIIKNSIIFCHSEDASIIYSNSRSAINLIVDWSTDKHNSRSWNAITVDERYAVCYQSHDVEDFIIKHPNYFRRSCCSCAHNPSIQSCVDSNKSSMQHYVKEISRHARENKETQEN